VAAGVDLLTLTFFNIDLEMSVEYEFIISVRGAQDYVTAPDSEIFTLQATAGAGTDPEREPLHGGIRHRPVKRGLW